MAVLKIATRIGDAMRGERDCYGSDGRSNFSTLERRPSRTSRSIRASGSCLLYTSDAADDM
eukprot:5545600-Alexandrium_andersonii.AAC.1